MKKTVILLALLGLVSVGTMAFVDNGNDNPPSRGCEFRHGHHGCHGHDGEARRHGNGGGCCGSERSRDCRQGYDCCGYRQQCGACSADSCTSEGCHRNGELCPSCAEWHNGHKADDVYRRR